MTTANGCVLAAVMLTYAPSLGQRWPGAGYGLTANRAPRLYEERLGGWRQRAHWAHLNILEMLAPFAAAVVIAQQAFAPQSAVDAWALAFVGLRSAYTIFYLADLGVPRTLAFTGSFACVIVIFRAAA